MSFNNSQQEINSLLTSLTGDMDSESDDIAKEGDMQKSQQLFD